MIIVLILEKQKTVALFTKIITKHGRLKMKKLKKEFWALLLCVILSITMWGCGEDDKKGPCLGSNENVIIGDPFYYGYLGEDAGPDSVARNQINNCGWTIYQNHNGGSGDTLAIENNGVILVWAWNELSGMTLTSGWTGKTDQGIGIGSSLTDFLTAYPNARRYLFYPEKKFYTFKNDEYTLVAFDKTNQLWGIGIGFDHLHHFDDWDDNDDTNLVDLSSYTVNFPGTWYDTFDNYTNEKIYIMSPPSRYNYDYELDANSQIRSTIILEALSLPSICFNSASLEPYKYIMPDTGWSGKICDSESISKEVIIKTYFDSTSGDWRFGKILLIVSNNDGLTGQYKLSVECPDGVDDGYFNSFCNIE